MGETRRKFGADFKAGAVRIVPKTGRPIAQVAQELGVNEGTLGNWVAVARRARRDGNGSLSQDEQAELVRLRRESAQLVIRASYPQTLSRPPWVKEAMGR